MKHIWSIRKGLVGLSCLFIMVGCSTSSNNEIKTEEKKKDVAESVKIDDTKMDKAIFTHFTESTLTEEEKASISDVYTLLIPKIILIPGAWLQENGYYYEFNNEDFQFALSMSANEANFQQFTDGTYVNVDGKNIQTPFRAITTEQYRVSLEKYFGKKLDLTTKIVKNNYLPTEELIVDQGGYGGARQTVLSESAVLTVKNYEDTYEVLIPFEGTRTTTDGEEVANKGTLHLVLHKVSDNGPVHFVYRWTYTEIE